MLARPVRQLASTALAVLLAAGVLPAPAQVAAAAPVGSSQADADNAAGAIDAGGEGGPGELPSTAYAEWLAHEHDRIDFPPGDRVTVGFKPRPDDRWAVGGQAPRTLPAGRAAGRDMARMGNGTAWTILPGSRSKSRDTPAPVPLPPVDAPVDAPSNGRPVAASAVIATTPASDPAIDVAASGLRRQVYGFLPYWGLSGASAKLDYDVLSTIAYFSVGATSAGNLKKRDADGTATTGWGGWTSSSMTQVINAAHRRGTRVVLTVSVFAWTSTQASVQRALLGSSSARRNLARQVVAAVRDRGADGVNLDFEPLASGYGDEFVALLRTLRSEFNKVRTGYQITYDTTAYIGSYPLAASVGRAAADAIFVMGYDYRIGSSSTAGSVDPLSGPSVDLADTVRAYKARVPGSRLILGIPWYGRAWSTATDKPRSATTSGPKYGYSAPVPYGNVLRFAAKYGRRWDSVEQSPYVVYRRENCTSAYGCVTSWRQIWYDDAVSLARRYQLVNDYGLRGAGIWALGYDGGHDELYRALASTFLVDRAAPVSGIRAIAPTQADEGFLVRWAGKDAGTVVSYDVQVSAGGGRWKAWRTGTKATSDVFLGRHGTGYAFRVRAKDGKGQIGAWSIVPTWDATPTLAAGGFARVTRDGLAYRTGPSTASARLGSLRAGTIVALTRGPVSRDGSTWYEVTEPIREWPPVSFVERGVWIAVARGASRFVAPTAAPNSTIVRAGIRRLDFGAPGTPTSVGTGSSATAARAFSPNGDRSEDGLRLRWINGMAMRTMKLNVLRRDGSLLGTRLVPDVAAGSQDWTWDGKLAGKRVKDGTYLLQLVGVAGGRAYRAPSAHPATPEQLAAYGVRVDTVPPAIASASATNQVISPNGDGVRDSTTLKLAAAGDAVRWTAVVTNASGATVRTKRGPGASASLTWNGTDDRGKRVPDGRYQVALTLFDAAGNPARRTGLLVVDTKAPTVTPAVSVPAFSPNGDGALDTTVLSFTANEPATGSARLYKGSTLVRAWKITDADTWTVTWNGTRSDGSRASDGVYALRIRVADGGGNVRAVSKRVVVDRTLRNLAWSGDFYPQDGDALKPTSTLSFTLARDAEATLRLYDAAGRLVWKPWSGKLLGDGHRSWKWTGTDGDGAQVPQGRYLATLRVTSAWATTEYTGWVWASAFAVVPNHTAVKAGQTLRIRFRSTEKLASGPRVTFVQPGRPGVTVAATRLADGSWTASFPVRAGSAGSGSIRVSAKDSGGGVNTTRIQVRVAS
jgi:spore germination protein YaaH/flagellar hook assembly protein FlgD